MLTECSIWLYLYKDMDSLSSGYLFFSEAKVCLLSFEILRSLSRNVYPWYKFGRSLLNAQPAAEGPAISNSEPLV